MYQQSSRTSHDFCHSSEISRLVNEISRLRIQLRHPRTDTTDGRNLILERFLDESTNYAESILDSDEGDAQASFQPPDINDNISRSLSVLSAELGSRGATMPPPNLTSTVAHKNLAKTRDMVRAALWRFARTSRLRSETKLSKDLDNQGQRQEGYMIQQGGGDHEPPSQGQWEQPSPQQQGYRQAPSLGQYKPLSLPGEDMLPTGPLESGQTDPSAAIQRPDAAAKEAALLARARLSDYERTELDSELLDDVIHFDGGDPKTIQRLLHRGADVNATHGDFTVLSFACCGMERENHLQVINLLLDWGATMEPSPEYASPLTAALYSYSKAKLLLDRGADPGGIRNERFFGFLTKKDRENLLTLLKSSGAEYECRHDHTFWHHWYFDLVSQSHQ